ncbi:hypothetical protein D9Q98_004666 [Chlorella vulgaris]|uniref:AB hydrolase-1 domain-containing protein n=1 Tax=Chlorella vulgaris TaxID=3077 RepID=A0A9D4TQC8_CHLVU|nr:hypothetical protein D9Q98_004666 [Chlorella vulgaris]
MFYTVNGYRLYVTESGSGEAGTVLFLHGFPDSTALWSEQVTALAAVGWRTVAPDLLGYGRSDKPQDVLPYSLGRQAELVLALMDALQCQQFCLVGHDFGAALAWRLAMRAPGRVLKLVVISVGSPAFFFAAGGMEQRKLAWYQLFFLHRPAAEEGLAAGDWALLRAMLAGESPNVQQQYIEALAQPGALTAALNWYRANTPPAMFAQLEPGKLPLVQCPTLGVWSSGDSALTEAQMKASQQQVVPCKWRYARLEGCNHWVPRGAAQQLNQLLLNFLPSDGDAATAPAAVSRL